ncbi:MAG: EcsC family protein [Verrucomicrobia bacterium]|nr:EcsC family protein [Verrucomicrobiota bacterium]MBT6805702.1 EcsC family protein [Verrucomicrobiota bacterium]
MCFVMEIRYEAMPAVLTDEELADLRRARYLLERPSFASRLTKTLGKPIEGIFNQLPLGWNRAIHRASGSALSKATRIATWTMLNRKGKASTEGAHQCAVMISGGLGGSLGLATLMWELPVSTTLMLRSIADIARSEGHSLRDQATRMSCLEVFAFEGRKSNGDDPDKHYWAVRLALAKAVSEAAAFQFSSRVASKSIPVMTRLISAVASRFGIMVSEQVAAKAIPIIGAASGMTINLMFMTHFQTIARGHFVIKRLEKKYGTETVQELYDSIAMPYQVEKY